MGAPTAEQHSPQYKALKHYSPHFPRFQANHHSLQQSVFNNDQQAYDLFLSMLQILPGKRAHIVDVVDHPYFHDLKK